MDLVLINQDINDLAERLSMTMPSDIIEIKNVLAQGFGFKGYEDYIEKSRNHVPPIYSPDGDFFLIGKQVIPDAFFRAELTSVLIRHKRAEISRLFSIGAGGRSEIDTLLCSGDTWFFQRHGQKSYVPSEFTDAYQEIIEEILKDYQNHLLKIYSAGLPDIPFNVWENFLHFGELTNWLEDAGSNELLLELLKDMPNNDYDESLDWFSSNFMLEVDASLEINLDKGDFKEVHLRNESSKIIQMAYQLNSITKGADQAVSFSPDNRFELSEDEVDVVLLGAKSFLKEVKSCFPKNYREVWFNLNVEDALGL